MKTTQLQLEVVQPKGRTKSYDQNRINIAPTSIGIGINAATKIGIQADDYIAFAYVGTDLYIAKKPVGMDGWPARKYATSKRLTVQSLEVQRKSQGLYEVSTEHTVKQQGTEWFKLIKL